MIGIALKLKINMKKNGLTLIETLTSVFIIAIISAIFIVNYREAGRQSDLQLATQMLITDIRYAQANALGLVEYEGADLSGGWGIYFNTLEPDKYIIFADLNNNKIYNEGEGAQELGAKTIILPENIKIESVGTADFLNIVFLPPDPLTYINQLTDPAYITLRDLNSNNTSTVMVNFAGLIEDI